MSTAILISGQLRTFARCWPTQRWHVLRHFEDPHFFITVQDPAPVMALDILSPLIEEYGPDRVHLDLRTDPDLTSSLSPLLSHAYHQAPYTNAAPAHQLLLQHWYQAECWKHFRRVSGHGPEVMGSNPSPITHHPSPVFDTIIRLRADLWFHSFETPSHRLYVTLPRHTYSGVPSGSVTMWRAPNGKEAFVPWWGKFGGINDRFAMMGPEAAKAYFTVYEQIPELLESGCPFHPETLVRAALERAGCQIHENLRTEFSTLRTNGQVRHWTSEVLPCDLRAA